MHFAGVSVGPLSRGGVARPRQRRRAQPARLRRQQQLRGQCRLGLGLHLVLTVRAGGCSGTDRDGRAIRQPTIMVQMQC